MVHKSLGALLMVTNFLQFCLPLFLRALALLLSYHGVAISAVLTIQVVDEGDPLSMAEVILVNAESREVIDNNFTDNKGIYRRNLEKGNFEVIVTKTDFVDVHVKNIVLEEGRSMAKIIELMPRGLQSNAAYLPPSSDGCD